MSFLNLEPTLKMLLDSGRYSDLTISCEGRNLAVHRAIVCSQSPFFDAAVKGGFKEASLSRVELPDDELSTIQRVISFLYVQNYDQKGAQKTQDIEDDSSAANEDVEPYAVARNNHRVFIAADKFEITRLKNLARVRLIDWIKTNPELFPVVVQEIWVTIPPMETELRNAIIKEIAYHAQIFLVHDKGITIMNDIPELTIDVLKATVELLKATVDENARLKAQARKVRSGW